jgi:hypothetical protein
VDAFATLQSTVDPQLFAVINGCPLIAQSSPSLEHTLTYHYHSCKHPYLYNMHRHVVSVLAARTTKKTLTHYTACVTYTLEYAAVAPAHSLPSCNTLLHVKLLLLSQLSSR